MRPKPGLRGGECDGGATIANALGREDTTSTEEETQPALGELIAQLTEERERTKETEIKTIMLQLRRDIPEAIKEYKTEATVPMAAFRLADEDPNDAFLVSFGRSRLSGFERAVYDLLIQETVNEDYIVIRPVVGGGAQAGYCEMVIRLP